MDVAPLPFVFMVGGRGEIDFREGLEIAVVSR